MLCLPKNDRLLFTFFGISLVSRRRSRSTEIRQVIVTKNKLYKIFGESGDFYKSVLIRDSKDSHYPYKKEYKDFENNPRWREFKAIDHFPTGLIVASRKHFAYVDTEKKEYDYTDSVNLIYLESDRDEKGNEKQINRNKIQNYLEDLPRRNQATFIRNGLIRYDEILAVDDKGDKWHNFPHIFVDFDSKTGPIAGSYEYLEIGKQSLSLEGYKRVKKFPKSFPEPSIGTIHEEKGVRFSDPDFSMLQHGDESLYALYEIDGCYSFLKPKDLVKVENEDRGGGSTKYYLQITHVESLKLKTYFKKYPESKWMIERQIGENSDMKKTLNIYEFKKTYDFVVDREKLKNKS